ncbi:hypothetical protein IACHDJAJ_00035 [Aeromonas phage vB_AdhS_TS3]|nr:hypothetical protein IACHDJAJ_00035 [Aeromonas phage vB_AdhS_TS3]
MKVIFRYPLKFIGDTNIKIQKNHTILSITVHPSGQPMLYCVVEDREPADIEISVRGIMTGEGFEWEDLGPFSRFLGTLNNDGGFVSHFFVTYYGD